jgi:hypothetical protein
LSGKAPDEFYDEVKRVGSVFVSQIIKRYFKYDKEVIPPIVIVVVLTGHVREKEHC